jgi:Ca2+/Na+ antiporter
MGAQSLTQLLTIFLILSIIILFVLVVVFIILTMKKKSQENSSKKETSIQPRQEEKTTSNIIQTKMYTTENVKKFMDFDEIKDNMILQKDGKRLVMVIQCQGVNYDLMSSIEKVGVEQGFIQFLNTLTRPIQLHIQSRKVNLEESVSNYKKRLKNIEMNFNKIRIQYEQA